MTVLYPAVDVEKPSRETIDFRRFSCLHFVEQLGQTPGSA